MLGVIVGAASAYASTGGAAVFEEGFYVNEGSFVSEGLEAPVSRLAQFSAQLWAQYGASNVQPKYLGVNDQLFGCGPGVPNHIYAFSGCRPEDVPACSSAGMFMPPLSNCFGTW